RRSDLPVHLRAPQGRARPAGHLLAVQADQAPTPHDRPDEGRPDRGHGPDRGAGRGRRRAARARALGGRPDHREERHLVRSDAGGADERVHRAAGPALQTRRTDRGRGHRVLQRPARDDEGVAGLGPGQRDGAAREGLPGHADAGLLRRPPLALATTSNENTHRLYREYLPKGTEIPDHQPYLTTIAEEINNRPRRRLGFLTPTESFARLLAGEPHVASTH